jgi:CRISPR/Cas system CSM-associated protein Csm3 (group 7 of RAMP superfamily)
MRPQLPILDLWRLTLEAVSPLSIASGAADLIDDVVLARTPAGLPCLPGTALAGVLRHALVDSLLVEQGDLTQAQSEAAAVFGHAEQAGGISSGQASRFECSHGHIHDARGQLVSDLLAEVDPADSILGPLVHRLPVKRQRVRLTARGAAADGGHFDRTVMPAGHRFSVELRVWSASAEDAAKARRRLDALLVSPGLRVGGQTRSGLGQLKVLAGGLSRQRSFDLRVGTDLEAYLALPRHLQATEGLEAWTPPELAASNWATLPMNLTAEDGLRVGMGDRALSARGQREKLADDLPYVENRVVWPKSGVAQLQACVVIPASAIKGPVAHRLAFHDRRRRGLWADAETVRQACAEHPLKTPGQARWLGDIKRKGPAVQDSRAGLLLFEDIVLPLSDAAGVGYRNHNSMDRFTGGVRDGILFSEEYLFRPQLRTQWHVNRRGLGLVDDEAWSALRATVDDLLHGRLAIGADSASGMGFLQAEQAAVTLQCLDRIKNEAGARA